MRLEGKVALITGGASGIGKATVLAFAQAGARVIAADIDLERGSAVARAAEQEGLAVEFVSIDLSASDSIRECAAAVLERHPRLDILVNAAGFSAVAVDQVGSTPRPPNYSPRAAFAPHLC